MELTEKNIEYLLNMQKEQYKLNPEEYCHSYEYHNRNLRRLNALLMFVKSDVRIRYKLPDTYGDMDGTALIENKFIFSLLSYKWKVIGKNVWYRSSGPLGFINKFVKEKNHG